MPMLPFLSILSGSPLNGSVADEAEYNRWRALTIDFLFVVRTPPLGRLLFIQAESSCFGMWVGEGCLTVLPMK